MFKIDEQKRVLTNAQSAANLARDVEDYMAEYENLVVACDIAKDIANNLLDKAESEQYALLATQFENEAKNALAKLHIKPEDLAQAGKRKRSKGFDRFVGEDKLKNYLTDTVIKDWREHNMKNRAHSGIFLYGPEGVSKTVLVQSLIHELNATGYYIDPISNFSPYSENTKAKFKRLFKMAEQKDNVVFYFTRPVCFFPQENNQESKATAKIFLKLLKKEIKRVKKLNLNILFVASSAAPDKMSLKAFGKGMFDDLLRVHHPDRHTRKGLMEERLQGIEFEVEDQIDQLVPVTHGYISKEISRLCRRIIKTAKLYGKDGKNAIITKEMMDRIMTDLGPMDDLEFKEHVQAFEASLPETCSIINDNSD